MQCCPEFLGICAFVAYNLAHHLDSFFFPIYFLEIRILTVRNFTF